MEKIKILIPTDFSEQAEFAFLLVQNLTRKLKADIHFIHVMEVPDTVTLDSNGKIQTCGEIDAAGLESRKKIIERKLAELHTTYGTEFSTHLRLGKVTDTLLDEAHNGGYHLVVMGTKGTYGIRGFLAGSEAQLIARKVRIPLLTLKCDRGDLDIRNILLVHDFEHGEILEMPLLFKIKSAFGAKLHLLQIVDDNTPAARAKSLAAMESYASKANWGNVETHVLADADVEKGVIHFNQMADMDLICIGTHGRSGLSHIFRTSATEKLIQHLFKPILTFQLDTIPQQG
jgi:nucleotide-binding universal stress UspA family protein